MSPVSSKIQIQAEICDTSLAPALAKDTTIADASQASQTKLTPEQQKRIGDWAKGMRNAMTKHNTPFDGRKRKLKAEKMRRARKANKKRKLYVRYGI